MIELVKSNDNLRLASPGHKHDNKELLDSVKKVDGRYYIDKKALRMLEDGATVKRVEFTTNDDDVYVMRLILGLDNYDLLAYNYIDIPIFSYYDAYSNISNTDEEDYQLGAVLDFGVSEYKPMGLGWARTNSNGYATIYPNVYYEFGTLEKLHIILGEGEEGYVNTYNFSFIAEGTTIFTLPEDVVWANDNEIVIEAGKRYEVSIYNNVALWNAATI